MIAVVIPVFNEEEHLEACLRSVRRAAHHQALLGESVVTIAVLDSCTDRSAAIARQWADELISVQERSVGAARRAGAARAIKRGARWLAFTDADSEVEAGWIVAQLHLNVDAVCGTVEVRDWGDYGEAMRAHYAATYQDIEGHRHIHGANMGVSARAYTRCGGFSGLDSSEDVALVGALERSGATIAWSALPRVYTSARRDFRAPGGFGATLKSVEARSASRKQPSQTA